MGFKSTAFQNVKIAVIGLGYVGLPLAVAFGRKFSVMGFDISSRRIEELKAGIDKTLEVAAENLNSSTHLSLTSDISDLSQCNVYIITVPTPITDDKKPDLTPLLSATKMVGKLLEKDDVVIYESTVYPGCTEEDCVPILEAESQLIFNTDFYCGYSPERINPGDKKHQLQDIVKVTSGSTDEIAEFIDQLYAAIITAGTHKAESIRIAEAAKIIENTQRDVNIALVNELSQLFNKMDIDTEAVLKAAGTKWNFLPFKPGLVGGHCIGVDPYYLTHKAQNLGYDPRIILAGRSINDGMGAYVANILQNTMQKRRLDVKNAQILILGITFKENCPDIRNSRVIDVVEELMQLEYDVDIHDPWASPEEVKTTFGISLKNNISGVNYSAIIIAVSHDVFKNQFEKIKSCLLPNGILYDLKHIYSVDKTDIRL